ncbi:MAG: ATP-dependent helicase, partial [Phaeodactylibacter sp.]|nr:ATP-dependent helicase [Phaeodactylibacter sp.]
GPGTGKTHILSSRIGHILQQTDAQAHNILCLTFTDAGVNAMRERLLQFIGPEAHRIPVYTFHSFCNSIIQDNLERFGRQELEPLSDLERVQLLRKILDTLGPDHALRLGRSDAYAYEAQLQHLFQQMKAESWTVDLIEQAINEYLEGLPNREEYIYKSTRKGQFQKGDLKKGQIEEETKRMERLRAAVRLYPLYQEAMQQANRYDYDDMILWVLDAFERYPNLLRTYQERFLYILVDEYQDTNGAQNEIIRKLVAYWELPNLFIVGDDDQSIYEFQGARLKNLTDIYKTYQSGLALVVLENNYRSAQPILDAARELIENNKIRIVNSLQELGIDKVLKASHPLVRDLPAIPEVSVFQNRLQEEVWLAKELQNLQESGVPLSEVAVIYAKHRQVEGLMELLEKKQIPYQTKRRVNILNLPVIRNLRQMLEYFAAEFHRPTSGEYLLFQIMHFSFIGLHPDDLAAISLYQARQEFEARQTWRELLMEDLSNLGLNLKEKERFDRFLSFHHRMIGQYNSLSAPAFAEQLINQSGLLGYAMEQPSSIWLMQVLRSFLNFVRQEAARTPRLTVGGLLDLLRSMDANRLPIEVNESIYAQDGVQLLTAHSAKGLEFKQVFLLDVTQKPWAPNARGSAFRFKLPDTLTYSGEEDPLEARRRLFYVAVTRAQERLHLSYALKDMDGKSTPRSQFLDELLQQSPLEVNEQALANEELLEAETLRLQVQHKPVLPMLDPGTADALLEGFRLSVSAMNRYLKCPLGFYYENVLRVPVLMREAAHYGTAMHYALERYFGRMRTNKGNEFPPLVFLLESFEKEMQRRRGNFSFQEFERHLESGLYNLKQYYEQHRESWTSEVFMEYRPRNVEVDGVPITGSIDQLIHISGEKAKVVDFKTGSQHKSKVKPPTPKNPEGGSFWRQLVFYKILYENHPGNTRVVTSGAISYLEPDKSGEMAIAEVQYQSEDVTKVRKMITEVYDAIRAHDFYTGCGEPDCPWCNFVNQHIIPETFAQADLEELDDEG